MQQLKTIICEQRDSLLAGFKEVDKDGTGKVSKADWVKIMGEKTGIHITWNLMAPKLTSKTNDGLIGELIASSSVGGRQHELVLLKPALEQHPAHLTSIVPCRLQHLS